ncbi:MAG: FecR domain-containing protein [Saprospiraceae bacterium]|nr:FecR domain-containing protein [Saprospiraceae bacterium]MCB9326667.1 FecR domain-containing protein [Lewinellaceae bacterium]
MDQKLHAEGLMAKYFSGNINSTEKEALLKWVDSHEDHRMYFDEMLQLWTTAEEYDNDFQADISQAWNKVSQSITEKPALRIKNSNLNKKKVSFLNTRIFLRVAAAVLFIVMAAYWWNSNRQIVVFETAFNETNQVELPDGTTVWLNHNSRITYHKAFKKRDVDLKGEAFFDVYRDESRPFTISSGTSKTRVLGTSFNVRAYPEEEEIIVTVSSGSVELSSQEDPKQKVTLKAREEGILSKKEQQVAKTIVENENSIAWKTQKLSFNNTPMREVFSTLERHFGVEFTIYNKAILDCEFFGTYDQPKLQDLIEAMKFAMGLEFEYDGKGYSVIGGKGCDRK